MIVSAVHIVSRLESVSREALMELSKSNLHDPKPAEDGSWL
jgi:hypothetical protein